MTGSAIEAWHEGLDGSTGVESGQWLASELARRGLMFGERPLCTVLRPRFLSRDQYGELRRLTTVLLGAFRTALQAALADPVVRAQFRLEPWEETLALEGGDLEGSPVSRLDAFYSPEDGRLRFTEYNAETPAGGAYNDALTELFLALPVMAEFRNQFAVSPLPTRHNVLHSLLRAWRRAGGSGGPPTIGILDWDEVPTQSEFRLFQEYFRSLGFPCVIGDPRHAEFRNGGLFVDGTRIDLIYKRVLISELVERGGLDHPIVQAVRSGAVCMANPFRCKLLHKKASFAVLSDERNAALFSAGERAVIADHLPWTRIVEERTTLLDGREIDLVPFVADNRENLVLKPNDDYGGAGVVLGWEVSDADWSAAVTRALSRPTIVQRRIGLPSEVYPSLVENQVVFADRIVDTAPFCFDGAIVDGCLTRVSTATLVNVTAGGGSTLPTFVVEPRP